MRDRMLLGVFVSVVLMAMGRFASAANQHTPPPSTLRHSDVVFMFDDPKQYRTYGCTVLGWAGGAGTKHIEEAHANGVRLFATSVGFLTQFSRMIDFSPDFLDAACRNFEGRPFVVPWLRDQKYKGQSAWWWCTNSPLYREYLKMRLGEVASRDRMACTSTTTGAPRRRSPGLGLLLPPLHGGLPREPGQGRAQGESGRTGDREHQHLRLAIR